MIMKEEKKIPYHVVFEAVEKAFEMQQDMLLCSECKKGFYKLAIVDIDEPDYILNDSNIVDENGNPYRCKDHVMYDLLVDPEVGKELMMPIISKKIGRKTQIRAGKIDAKLFLPNRTN